MDTTEWKEFKYKDVFVIKKGFYNKKPEHIVPGNIPFLGATERNNGVTEYYSIEDIESASKTGDDNNAPLSEKLFPPKAVCVTNNGSVGFAYYHDEQFTCSHDVNPLYIKDGEFNSYSGVFVATVIMRDRYRWTYGRKWRPVRMVDSVIRLPVTEEGKPDWDYMTNYIKSLGIKNPKAKKNSKTSPELKTTEWHSFIIGKLFTKLERGKNKASYNLEDGDDCYYVGAKKDDNGIMRRVIADENLISKGNCIVFIGNGEGSVGYTNYMDDDFIGTSDITVGYNKNLNSRTGMFIVTVLDLERPKYSHGRKWSSRISNTIVKLPAVKLKGDEYRPDWSFMENYIQSLSYGDIIK